MSNTSLIRGATRRDIEERVNVSSEDGSSDPELPSAHITFDFDPNSTPARTPSPSVGSPRRHSSLTFISGSFFSLYTLKARSRMRTIGTPTNRMPSVVGILSLVSFPYCLTLAPYFFRRHHRARSWHDPWPVRPLQVCLDGTH